MEREKYRIFKLVVVGHSAVGKSCILQRLCKDTFAEKHNLTSGVDFVIKSIELEGEKIKLYIWDTSDEESHRALVDFHCRPALGYIVVYDVTEEKTFKGIETRIKHLKEIALDKDPSFIIVGNKTDQESRQVNSARAEQIAAENSTKFIEVSAKTSAGIDNAFYMIANDIKSKLDRKVILEGQNAAKQDVVAPETWFGWLSSRATVNLNL